MKARRVTTIRHRIARCSLCNWTGAHQFDWFDSSEISLVSRKLLIPCNLHKRRLLQVQSPILVRIPLSLPTSLHCREIRLFVLKIAGNRRNSAIFAVELCRRKRTAEGSSPFHGRFSLELNAGPTLHACSGEWLAITNRMLCLDGS